MTSTLQSLKAATDHPLLLAELPELGEIAARLRDLGKELESTQQDNAAKREAWQRASDRAVLEGSEVPAPPVVVADAELRRQFTVKRQALTKRRDELLVEHRAQLAERLAAREQEILSEVRERLFPQLRSLADEVGQLGRAMTVVVNAGDARLRQSDVPTPRTSVTDVDELLHVAVAGAGRLSFLAGYARGGVRTA